MEEVTSDTIIVTKEGWSYLQNARRIQRGFDPLPQEKLDNTWRKIRYKNEAGETFPIKENEIRIDRFYFSRAIPDLKAMLEQAGLTYREDGYISQSISI